MSVLLVEYHDDARDLAGLESSGATAATARSAQAALEALATSRADVLVTAIGLPDRDGFALLREVRAHEEGTDGAQLRRGPGVGTFETSWDNR